MARNIRIKAVKRREVDEDKLALAFLMLAKVIQKEAAQEHETNDDEAPGDREAA
jgi:hypothetical protein